MKNTFGTSLSVTLFGESHGEVIGCVLDGIAPGIAVDEEYIAKEMQKRQGEADLSTARREADEVKIVSGVLNGKTTGAPVTFLIENKNVRSADYRLEEAIARPSHADYVAHVKYHGYEDLRGGGHFSGRLTAPLVAAGALVKYALEKKGVRIASHVASVKGVKDKPFTDFESDFASLSDKLFPVIDGECADRMRDVIRGAREEGDSVGGTVECAVIGVPCGVGEPFFDSLESVISHAVFSIPAVKGIEFGAGFALADMKGSEANDAFEIDGEVKTKTNNSGGINGGISNGMPVVFKAAVRPTPSIAKEQDSVYLAKSEETKLQIHGRHDPAIVSRVCPVINAVTALAIADALCQRYGTDYLFCED